MNISVAESDRSAVTTPQVLEHLTKAPVPAVSRAELSELVEGTIRRTVTNRNVMAIVTGEPADKLSSLTVPIFSQTERCGDPRAVVGVGKATQLDGSDVRELLKKVRKLEATNAKDPNAPISPESMKGLFETLLAKHSGMLDLGVYPESAIIAYQGRMNPGKFGIKILKDEIIEKELSGNRKLISVPARFPDNRIDIGDLVEYTKEYLPEEETPMVLYIPVLQPAVDHDQAIRHANIYVIFGGHNVALIHDADRVANAMQYGRDPVEQIINKELSEGAAQVDPLTIVVELLRDIDRVHSETLALIESRLNEVGKQQQRNDGHLKGVKTVNEVNRLTVSLNEAQREILHVRGTTTNLLSACSSPEFVAAYGDEASIVRNRGYIGGLTDRLTQDQELVTGLHRKIESMHATHGARESISSHKARNLGALAAMWATPLMGAHYAAAAAAEHGLKINGHLAIVSLAASGLASLWFYRKDIFGRGR